MGAGERFANWITTKFEVWKANIGTFILTLFGPIGQIFWNLFRSQLEGVAKENLRAITDDPNTPPEVRAMLAEAQASINPGGEVMAWFLTIVGTIVSILHLGGPQGRNLTYFQDRKLKSFRLDPLSIITAWRRDPGAYASLFDDLKDQGWSDERIEALKFVTLYYPPPADLIRWQAREVFEPAMIERYGLDSEFEAISKDPFYKAGMTDEQILNYWRAHWEHASWQQVVEMLHRGLLTEAQVYDWFRLVEIPPFWRDKMIQAAYTWPTRVDVRRWWDMRTIDEAELRRLYSGMGYRGVNLDNYVLWTKVYVAFPDLLARWSKGWITLDEVRQELVGLGMPAARVEEMIQTKIKVDQPERTSAERDVTKTDIYKGVKQGVITRGEAIELLMELGFDIDEADYLLAINIPADNTDQVVSQRQLTKADILKGLREDIIKAPEALVKLQELRYSLADAQFLLSIFNAQVQPPAESREREASKADIVLGVKRGLITQEEGYLMLLDLGFSPEAAEFVLLVKTEESPFSPRDFAEFKDLTHKYRLAAGREVRPMSEELKAAAAVVVRVTGEIEALERAIAEERRTIVDEDILPAPAAKRLKGLTLKLHRAESELTRVHLEYNKQLAEWRHSPGAV
jgi:hypothetical protein